MARQYHYLMAAALAAAVALSGINCGKKSGAFHPSPPQATIDTASLELKTVRSGYVTFDRTAIQNAIASDDRYAPLVDRAKSSVEKLVAMSDDEIRAMIPPAKTIRALMVNRKGCPVHGGGTSVYQPFGITVDLDYPLAVKCPIGGEVYPNKDFPDDGSGWVDNRPGSPTKGEKYYFVGWFNHWFLQKALGMLKTMGQLWVITGDDVYAHKAQVLLERFMEVYPDIDSNDLTYDGTDWGVYIKMLPTMWEGTALMNLTDCVECILPTLDDGFVERFHKSVFYPAFEAYKAKPAPSNWGNVWNAPFARIVTLTGDKTILDYMLYNHPVAVMPVLDNQYFSDGFPYEAAFSYGSHYMYDDRDIADVLGKNGGWIWEHPHLKNAYRAFAEAVVLDKFTHFFGDTGGLSNKGMTLQTGLLEEAFRRYRSPLVARNLIQAYDLYGTSRSVSIDDLFRGVKTVDIEDVKRVAAEAKPMKSTLAPVRGFAIMRTGEGDDRAALFFDYGYAHAAHSHADRLNINLFAQNREFLPEMGYPEYMDSIAPTPGGWTTHTVSHVTVEVDEKRQLEGVFGDLKAYVDADGIKYVDASCEDAYVHCGVNLYRRSLALIDIPGGAYVVDIFRIGGGHTHDYLFHGPVAPMTLSGVALSKPRKGTFAGEDVAFGEKPDDVLPYHVDNKGYQYLYDVSEGSFGGVYGASWAMDDGVSFSAAFIPAEGETFYKTMGYPRPSSQNLPPMPFLIRRRNASGPDDVSQFATVMSYTKGEPVVLEVQRLAFAEGSDPTAYGVAIRHQYGEDVVISTLSPDGYAKTSDGRYELKGQFGAVCRRNGATGKMILAGGTSFTADGASVTLDKALETASVREIYDDKLVLDTPLPADRTGRILFTERGPARPSFVAESIEGNTVSVYPGVWIGRGRVDRIDAASETIFDSRDIFPLGEKRNRLADITGMKYPEGNRNYYAGAWMVSPDGTSGRRMKSGGFPGFVLDKGESGGDIAKQFPEKSDFLLYDLGPGDKVWMMNWKEAEVK